MTSRPRESTPRRSPSETLINRRSRTWREIPEEDRDISDPDSAAALAVANPKLVKRPVFDLGANPWSAGAAIEARQP